MTERIILHLDMDYFFAQIEERENPQFKGKPVVVGAEPFGGKGRGVVSTANYEARKFGIHSGMPISRAYKLCPQAIFLPVNMRLYVKVSGEIMEIIKKYSDIWEISGLDEAYLDVSFAGDFENAEKLAMKIKKEIFEKEKLTATIGIGPNKMIAKIAAAQKKPDGLQIVKRKDVSDFLDLLDIEELPGIGPKTAKQLCDVGINKIGELKKAEKNYLTDAFGKWGEGIYWSARGIDESPVVSEYEIKSVGREHTFFKDTRDPEIIFQTFDDLIGEVFKEIKENNFRFRTITVVCRFSGFETHTKAKTLAKDTGNYDILKTESKKLLLRFLLENLKPVRLVGIRVKISKR